MHSSDDAIISKALSIDYASPRIDYRPSRLAVASLASGVIGLVVPLLGMAGVALGILATRPVAHANYRSRFLARRGISCGLLGTALTGCAICFFLERSWLARGSDAQMARCARNLSTLEWAIIQYRNGFGVAPPDLTSLSTPFDWPTRTFMCPLHDDLMPAKAGFTSDPAARAAGALDYVFTGEGLTSANSYGKLLLVERLADHGHQGAHVLFVGRGVEFVSESRLLQLLAPLKGTPQLTQEEYDAIVAK